MYLLGSDGVKGALTFDVAKKVATGTINLDKSFSNGSSLNLRAIYQQSRDVFILEETWKLDPNNKLTGTYNFATEEALFGYTYTKGDWSASGRYNFSKDSVAFDVQSKQGKATFGAGYVPKDKVATLTWSAKPFRASIKGNVGKTGVSAPQAFFTVTHEFDV